MPSINPTQLRALAQRLADNDGKLDASEIDQLVDATMQEGALAPEVKAELQSLLATHADKIESPEAKKRLESFLAISDEGIRNLAHKLERDDGVLDASDADKVRDLVNADGKISGSERFSLSALLVGTRMTPEARTKIERLAERPEIVATRTPNAAVPDNDPNGVTDTLSVAESGKLSALSVDVDVPHTYRGDLTLKLTAPDGTSVLLHDRSGSGSDDIRGNFPGTLQPKESLDKLNGVEVNGDWKLSVVDSAGIDTGTLKSWTLHIRTAAAEGGAEAKNLDPTGAHRPVYLSPAGFFVEDPTLDRPANNEQLGTGLFRMADLVDDLRDNPFAAANLSADDKQKVLGNLAEALAKVPVGGPVPADMTEKQALQMRSSAATVLMALLESTGTTSADQELKAQAFTLYTDAVKAEQNPILRDSMIWNLSRVAKDLPASLKPTADALVAEMAPAKPPYDEWFKDGNKTLNISWRTGADEEFFPGAKELLEQRGFKPEGDVPPRGPAVFTKTMTRPNGEEVEVRVHLKVNRSDIFAEMDEPDMHIVGYDGHSDIGRTIPGSLRGAPDADGKKLIFYGLCAGKDNLDNVRERYPDAQLLTTFTSSYFNTTERDGKKVMTRSENFNVLMELVEGTVKGSDWETINREIRRDAILYPYHHVMPGGTNYISPAHTAIRRKALDSDNDGQADYLDKFANFDTFKVATDTRREFEAIKPSRPADVLDGTVTHLAAMALNTATGYNSVTSKYKDGNIIGDGYFEPKDGETAIVKFERATVDGERVVKMKVNSHYAHMSAEALRAVAQYEFIQLMGDEAQLSPVDQKLMGLTFAAFSIMYDMERWGRDDAIWQGVLATLGLPEQLSMQPIRSLLDAEHHDYSGNMEHVRKWKAQIAPELLAALEAE